MTLLRFDQVTLIRGGRQLFAGMDLELGRGDALQLKGLNGSGKSSLIRAAAGLLLPAAGRIDAAPLALADDFLALDREQPLGRALAFWGGGVEEAMAALGIAHIANVPVRLLSTGQEKRARLARVVASGAPLWLLDEPANGLDREGLGLLAAAFERHRAAGGAILAASHVPLAGEWRTLELKL